MFMSINHTAMHAKSHIAVFSIDWHNFISPPTEKAENESKIHISFPYGFSGLETEIISNHKHIHRIL